MDNQFDVIIIGGGLVGCAFALDLAKNNPHFNISLIEASEQNLQLKERFDNRIYAISPLNIEYLKSLDAWPGDSRIGQINTMDVYGNETSNIILERNLPKTLFLAKTIEYKYLLSHIYEKLNECLNVTLIYDSLDDIKNHDEHLELITPSGQHYKTSLLVGADGANSKVRQLANLDFKVTDYQEFGVVANFSCELPHKNIAYQWFLDNSVLAYLPLPNNNISIVWSTQDAKRLTNMESEEFSDLVAKVTNNKLGKLTATTQAVAFPLKMYVLNKVYANKMVVIGDAAHTIHPLAGQGVNLGFKDAKLLASILSKCKNYQLIDSGNLAKYSASRQLDVKQMQFTCDTLHRLFASNSNLIKTIRNRGLNFVNLLPLIKRNLMNHAS